jgi:sec-independent protein translocase protein TatB
MFDIGFSELLIIAVVGLLVIGPARLPETLRTLALWLGRLRRMASKLYQEVEREVGMDDVRRQLHNENIMDKLSNQIDPEPDTRPQTPPGAENTTTEPDNPRKDPGDN